MQPPDYKSVFKTCLMLIRESSILYQVDFTEEEMTLLNKQVRCDIPRKLAFQGETYSNVQQQWEKSTQENDQSSPQKPQLWKKKPDWLVCRFKNQPGKNL